MRQLIIPGIVNIDNTDYSVNIQIYQDNVISTIYQRTGGEPIEVDFTERVEGYATIEQAKNWIRNQLVVIDPFVFTEEFYYIGKDIDKVSMQLAFEGFNIEAVKLAATGNQPSTIEFMNGVRCSTHNADPRIISGSPDTTTDVCYLNSYGGVVLSQVNGLGYKDVDGQNISLSFSKVFFPSSSFNQGMFKETTDKAYRLSINIYMRVSILGSYTTLLVESVRISMSELDSSYFQQLTIYGDLIDIPFEDLSATAQGFSGDNPYEISPSSIGGGYGTGVIRPSDPIPDPEAPDIDAITTGLLTVFKPTRAQIQSLGDYLWSSAFDVNTLKKLFSDPMEAIIGLSIIPINPPAAGSKNVKIGDIDTGITMPYISRQFVEKDLGSITIEPYIGSFMDYAPYTKIDIYLPYIGFRSLDPADVMGTTLSIKYIIDVVTGGCNAVINVSGKGAIYQFNGSCIANIPLSAINYSGAIQNAVSAIGSGITTAVGVATGQTPIAAMGVAGLATQAANTAVNTKEHIQRSGSMGGAAGLCSVQFPYVVIERPRLSTPEGYNRFIGNTLNVTMRLADCHGLTMVESIHLDNVLCTDEERNELLNLLKEGVIL